MSRLERAGPERPPLRALLFTPLGAKTVPNPLPEPFTIHVMSSGVRELRVWQESVALAGDVIRAIRQGMRRETTSISDAAMATALSVASHIADGYGRATPPEQRESYLAAKRALLRLETELAVAKHADLLPAGSFTELVTRANQVAKMLAGYVVYLDRQLADDVRVATARGATADPVSLGSARAPS
jgi:four helix bundle protein